MATVCALATAHSRRTLRAQLMEQNVGFKALLESADAQAKAVVLAFAGMEDRRAFEQLEAVQVRFISTSAFSRRNSDCF